ncbi:APC family permease [Treponema sp.]|uniref:APC family permease n=1 Tax=Treponema sp. TaxID=166 RepID=UPI003EFE7E16
MEEKKGGLAKSMRLMYVYAMATGAIFTFMCYWDGIFMSYTGPGTFLAFALMTVAILPTAFVYSEFSTMLPQAGSCLVFNTVGLNKHAGFWSAWLIMCAWIAVPAAGVLGILEWINFQFGTNFSAAQATAIGSVMLCFWCALSLYKNVVAGKIQSFMLIAGICGILVCSVMFFLSGHWSIENFSNFFTSSNMQKYGGAFSSTGIAWMVGCAFMITPYFGFETVPAMVEEGTFPITDQKKAILGSVVTCGVIYVIFYFAMAGAMPWNELTNSGDCHPFVTFDALKYCFGDKIAWFVLIMGIVGIVFPIGTSVLGFWYSGVRMIYAMGKQNFLPKSFAVTNRFSQPIVPNILILVVSIGFIAMQEIRAFFDLMAFACTLCYSLTSISSLVLESKHPEWPRPYKCLRIIKVLSLVIMLMFAFFTTIGIGRMTWYGFIGYMAVGALLWLYMILYKWRHQKVVMNTPEGQKEF